jgi:hypothetical protein
MGALPSSTIASPIRTLIPKIRYNNGGYYGGHRKEAPHGSIAQQHKGLAQ